MFRATRPDERRAGDVHARAAGRRQHADGQYADGQRVRVPARRGRAVADSRQCGVLGVFFLIWVFLIIVWAASDQVDAGLFATLTTILTFGYLLSRGIAKASRVLEQ